MVKIVDIEDMPKLESSFVREKVGDRYIVTPNITPGHEWVFNDNENVLAVEKLDGNNVSVVVFEGTVISVWSRTERVPFINKGKKYIIEAVQNSYERGYVDLPDGQWFGEVIGPKIQQNHYKLDEPLWIPFNTYARKKLSYKSWGKYPKTYEAISTWFKDDIFSLYMANTTGDKNIKPEGIVFHNLKTGEMSKLRRDMFDWYAGKGHKQE